MNITNAVVLAKTLMSQHGLSLWNFQFDRSVRRLGYCSYTTKTISLGHSAGHGPVWQAKAREIGCDGKRLGHIAQKAAHSWEMICPKCQVKWQRYRRPQRGLIHLACRTPLNVYRVQPTVVGISNNG